VTGFGDPGFWKQLAERSKSMSIFTNAIVLITIIDAGKVRLGGFAPSLSTADAGKVRLGGFAPSLSTTRR
jgi:hypothetical protein